MLVLAHRGVHHSPTRPAAAGTARPPENTPAAFERTVTAHREGRCDGVEFDVRADAGGAAVVSHDETLTRVFGRPERVRDLGARALKKLTASDPTLGGGVITLDEALEILAPLPLIDIEIKAEGPFGEGALKHDALIRSVIRSIAQSGLRSRVIVTSFNPVVLAQLKAAYPPVTTGLLIGEGSPAWLRSGFWTRVIGAQATALWSGWYTPEKVGRFFGPGIMPFVWTVNDAATRSRVIETLPPHALITDDVE
jgi:glycerophosphoryl diester phosphodiesterase